MKINSEIFDEYAKIALKEGLISEAEEKTNPRYDSLELSDIEILYGVKPNGEDDDILDKAHPKPMIIAPAYDRLNGLVENLKERSNVMKGIARKPNDGKLTQHRYVQATNQELLDEVVKIAFMLDKNDQEDLMVLADNCAERLSKQAWTWGGDVGTGALMGGVGGAAYGLAALGLLSNPAGWAVLAGGLATIAIVNNFSNKIDQGVQKNCARAIDELNGILKENEEHAKSLAPQISFMIENIQYVRSLGDKALTIRAPKPGIITAANYAQTSAGKQAKELLEDYKDACIELANYLPSWIQLLDSAAEVSPSSEREYGVTTLFRKIWHVFSPESVSTANDALKTLSESLHSSTANLDKLYSTVEENVNQNKEKIKDHIENKVRQERTAPINQNELVSIQDQIAAKKKQKSIETGTDV